MGGGCRSPYRYTSLLHGGRVRVSRLTYPPCTCLPYCRYTGVLYGGRVRACGPVSPDMAYPTSSHAAARAAAQPAPRAGRQATRGHVGHEDTRTRRPPPHAGAGAAPGMLAPAPHPRQRRHQAAPGAGLTSSRASRYHWLLAPVQVHRRPVVPPVGGRAWTALGPRWFLVSFATFARVGPAGRALPCAAPRPTA